MCNHGPSYWNKEADMKIENIELTLLDVPFTKHTNKHLGYWLPHWRIIQICTVTLTGGIKGYGETIPNYTWTKVPDDIIDRALGQRAAELMWDDSLGAGVQMALFDAVAKAQNVPVYALMGTKTRDWCPISWWNMDMPPEGWKEECRQAVAAGYTSAKLKARPWFDLKAAVTAVRKVVPPGFHLDLDYNGTLGHSANAIPHLRSMEAFEEIAMIETPIPQNDVAGNRKIRQRTGKPIAMHYGNPPAMTALKEDVADGFVLCAGATRLTRQAAVCDEANKPFWLQLVGTGITTAWAAHLGAVLPQAKWPAITCMNIWQSQLTTRNHEIRGGYYPVSDKPGLGITLDRSVIKRHKVNYDWVHPPRHLYEYSRKSGEVTRYACSKQDLHHVYPKDAQPISEPGSRLNVIEDDGSAKFKKLWESASKDTARTSRSKR
jgi:L-alanine-DL-glutamate epimerase-like enolase superfamily enzyme